MNMTSLKLSALVVLAFADIVPVNAQPLSFDTDGRLPAGWKEDATGGRPAEWQVVPRRTYAMAVAVQDRTGDMDRSSAVVRLGFERK